MFSEGEEYCFLQVRTWKTKDEAFQNNFARTVNAIAFEALPVDRISYGGKCRHGAYCLIKMTTGAEVCTEKARAFLQAFIEWKEVQRGSLQLPRCRRLIAKKTCLGGERKVHSYQQ